MSSSSQQRSRELWRQTHRSSSRCIHSIHSYNILPSLALCPLSCRPPGHKTTQRAILQISQMHSRTLPDPTDKPESDGELYSLPPVCRRTAFHPNLARRIAHETPVSSFRKLETWFAGDIQRVKWAYCIWSITQIQQLAAVELRKRVGSGKAKLWAKTQPALRNQIKSGILQGLAGGSSSCVFLNFLHRAIVRFGSMLILAQYNDVDAQTSPC
jgi:hypothetical protein